MDLPEVVIEIIIKHLPLYVSRRSRMVSKKLNTKVMLIHCIWDETCVQRTSIYSTNFTNHHGQHEICNGKFDDLLTALVQNGTGRAPRVDDRVSPLTSLDLSHVHDGEEYQLQIAEEWEISKDIEGWLIDGRKRWYYYEEPGYLIVQMLDEENNEFYYRLARNLAHQVGDSRLVKIEVFTLTVSDIIFDQLYNTVLVIKLSVPDACGTN